MKINGDMAELMGIHIGDGCISVNARYSEYYLGGDITEEVEYHDKWVSKLFNKKVMFPLYGKKVTYKFHPKVGIYGFHIFDKKIVNFFNKLGIKSGPKTNVEIPKIIFSDKNLTKRFLRGLLDTDGNIYFDKNRTSKNPINNCPVIQLGTVSEILCNQIFDVMFNLGFHPRKKKPHQGKRDKNFVHTILLYRRGDIRKYINEIGFKNPKHYTKWLVFKKLGLCPPNTKLKQRQEMLKQKSL